MDKLERFISALQKAYAARGRTAPSPSWEHNLMRDIRHLAASRPAAGEDALFAAFFLRFGAAALVLALLLHTTYRISSIEEQLVRNSLMQMDPFNDWNSDG